MWWWCGEGLKGGRGWDPAGRGVGALSLSVTLPSPPSAGGVERGGASCRGPGVWGRGRAEFSASRAAHGARRPLSSARSPKPAVACSCALGGSPDLGSAAPGKRAWPWSLRTKTPRRQQRRRRWQRQTPGGRPRPAGWWFRSARRRAPCAPPSPTCPSPWPSSASSSTLSCQDWVRLGSGDT